jgi:uncharacterized protein (DUF2249 family)
MIMDQQIDLDVRGLEPPEPLERVLEALTSLQRDQTICMLIDREPRPLYAILQRNGYSHETTLRPDYFYEVRIRHAR